MFYNMVVAQAQKIEVAGDRVTFSFAANQRTLRDTFEQNKPWLEGLAQQVAGRKVTFACVQTEGVAQAVAPPAPQPPGPGNPPTSSSPARVVADKGESDDSAKKSALRERALADAGVQALLEVFPAEIRDVEEM